MPPLAGVPMVRGPGHVPGLRASPNEVLQGSLVDTFGHTVTGGLGAADTGQVWSVAAGTFVPWSEGGGTATVTPPTAGGTRRTLAANVHHDDADLFVDFTWASDPTGAAQQAYFFIHGQGSDLTNSYRLEIEKSPGTNAVFRLNRFINSAATAIIATTTLPFDIVAGTWYSVHINAVGGVISVNVWDRSTGEPAYLTNVTDTTFLSGEYVGIGLVCLTGNTNLPVTQYDNLSVQPAVPGVVYSDTGTVGITLTPSSVDVADLSDGGTVPVVITPQWQSDYLLAERFLDTTTNGWGSVDEGSLSPGGWLVNTGPTNDVTSGSGIGTIVQAGGNTYRVNAVVALPTAFEAQGTYNVPTLPGSSNVQGYIAFYIQDQNNYYRCQMLVSSAGQLSMQLQKVVAGTATSIGVGAVFPITTSGTYTAGEVFNWKLKVNGNSYIFKMWDLGTTEPSDTQGSSTTSRWGVDTSTDTTYSSGDFGLYCFGSVAATIAFGPFAMNTYAAASAYTDSGTVGMVITPSTVEARVSTDAVTVGIALTPSAAETAQLADTSTVTVTLTPSASDTAQFVDSNTPRVTITPSSADTAQFVDTATTTVVITPSSTDVAADVEAATVSVAITPSAAETAQFVDANTAPVVITPSTVEARVSTDAVTVPVAITPSGVDVYTGVNNFVDSATAGIAITPSDTEAFAGVDSATVTVKLSPAGAFDSLFAESWLDTVSNGWGTVDYGSLSPTGWTLLSGSTASLFSAGGGFGSIAFGTGSTQRINAGVSLPSIFNIQGTYKSDVPPTSNTQAFFVFFYQDQSNYYRGQLTVNSTAQMTMQLQKVVAGVVTNIGSTGTTIAVASPGSYTAGDVYNWKLYVNGSTFTYKVWIAGTDEPAMTPTGGNTSLKKAVDASSGDTTFTSGDFGLWAFGNSATVAFGPLEGWPTAPGTDYADTNTVTVAITPSALDVVERLDAATVALKITPTSTDTAQDVEAATVGLVVTPSTVETAQFADTSTVPVSITAAASTEQRVSTDSATVPMTLTASGVESAQFVDSANVPILLTPSTVEASQFADAVSVGLKVTPSSTDTAQYVESATIPVTLTPSLVEVYGRTLTDTGTVGVALTPSAQESAVRVDAATVPVTITTSATEALVPQSADTSTVPIAIQPADVQIAGLVDSATIAMTLTPSATDVPERAFIDSAEVYVTMTPITSLEDIVKADGGTPTVYITPFALSEFQGDGDIVPVRITSALVEVFVHEDSNVILLSIDPDALEEASLTTTGDVYFRITPDIAEIFESVDDATILVSITPGIVFEIQQVADYLLVGVLSSKWTAILRDNTYAGTLFETRYVVVGFDNRWHYHYRGRGDE